MVFELFHPLDVAFERLAAGPGPGGAAGVGGGDEQRVGVLDAEVVVVAGGGVDHFAALAVALEQVGADLGVAAFGLVVGGLADVVQQAAPPGQHAVHADLFGQHPGQEGHLDAVPQHVLAVAGAEVEPAQEVDDPLVQAVDVDLLAGRLAQLLDVAIQLLLRLGDDLLDPRGMDSPVGDELVEREPGDLAADGVEGADDDHAGGVVDDDVDAGGLLEGADVAPSRPMIRPFISSLGISTELVVVSAVWAAA